MTSYKSGYRSVIGGSYFAVTFAKHKIGRSYSELCYRGLGAFELFQFLLDRLQDLPAW